MTTSYGETSGFSVVSAEELLLVNGGKGGGGGGNGGNNIGNDSSNTSTRSGGGKGKSSSTSSEKNNTQVYNVPPAYTIQDDKPSNSIVNVNISDNARISFDGLTVKGKNGIHNICPKIDSSGGGIIYTFTTKSNT